MISTTRRTLLLLLVQSALVVQLVTSQNLQLQFDTGELSQCRRLFAVADGTPVAEAGFLCLVIDPTVLDSISVSYSTSDGWVMEETSAWFNTDIGELPADNQGEPDLEDFPYLSEDQINADAPVASFRFDVLLEDMQVPACGGIVPLPVQGGTSVLGVAYAALFRQDATTQVEENADGWADGVLPTDPDSELWTLFNFTIQCVQATTPSPTLPPTTQSPTTALPLTPAPTLPITPAPLATTAPLATAAPVMAPTPPPVTASPTDPPISAALTQDGGMCDSDIECQSGSCSITGFCLISTGSACANDELCGTGACINGVCNTCEGAQSSTSILTKDVMETSFAAAQLTQSLQLGFQDNPPAVTATNINFYNLNGNDPSMVAKVNGVCYGVFAPQEETDLATFGTLPVETFQQTCQVHKRAHAAYFSDERQFFELQLAQCASTCASQQQSGGAFPMSVSGKPTPIAIKNEVVTVDSIIPTAIFNNACPIVLTGHGLGGATATVGSMMLADLQPTVITFGAPRTVAPDCGLLTPTARSQSHYRYVNLAFAPSYNTYLFDSIPQLGDGSLVHYGNPIFLDEMETIVLPRNDNTTRAHAYDNNNAVDPNNDANIPSSVGLYSERIAALNMESCFPVPADSSWQEGHWCDDDDVCSTGRCRAFVTIGEDYSTGICFKKALDGEVCLDNSDCISDICNVGACLGGVAGGGDGNEDTNSQVTPVPAITVPVTPGPTLPMMVPAPPLGTPAPPLATPAPTPGTPLATPAPTPDTAGGGGGTVGSCGPCASNGECVSGICNNFMVPGAPGGSTSVCAETAQGTMATGCFCSNGDNTGCTDGRCEGDASGMLFLCFSPLPPCQACDEDSDCLSANCVEGVCGLQGGGPADCGDGGGNQAPPQTPSAACLLCEENDECTAAIGGSSMCSMGICTMDTGLLDVGCPCSPRSGGDMCVTGVCGNNHNLLSVCIDDNGEDEDDQGEDDEGGAVGAPMQMAAFSLNGGKGSRCMVDGQCNSNGCNLWCNGRDDCSCDDCGWKCN